MNIVFDLPERHATVQIGESSMAAGSLTRVASLAAEPRGAGAQRSAPREGCLTVPGGGTRRLRFPPE
jgi:hypothetical protein